jgi:hypothetical protein
MTGTPTQDAYGGGADVLAYTGMDALGLAIAGIVLLVWGIVWLRLMRTERV